MARIHSPRLKECTTTMSVLKQTKPCLMTNSSRRSTASSQLFTRRNLNLPASANSQLRLPRSRDSHSRRRKPRTYRATTSSRQSVSRVTRLILTRFSSCNLPRRQPPLGKALSNFIDRTGSVCSTLRVRTKCMPASRWGQKSSTGPLSRGECFKH